MPTTTPSAVWRTWFPATVALPDDRTLRRVKVFATDTALMVYAQGPGTGPLLVFESPILLDKTPVPATDYASERRGHLILTEAGKVSVVKGGGCSCGMRALKAFTPANVERAWGE